MMQRRDILGALGAAALWPSLGSAQSEAVPFSRDILLEQMRAIAARPYQPRTQVPKAWQNLSYDEYRGVRILHAHELWRDSDTEYRMNLFPPGLYWPTPVHIHVVEDGHAALIPWDRSRFEFADFVPELPESDALGYSGFRLSSEINHPGSFTEFLVMQGASYFRAVSEGQFYGLSGRGLAIDTAQPSGEEFPEFTQFWIERPPPGQRDIKIHALMESPSVTGLFLFDVFPGSPTMIEVDATLIPRRDLTHVGVAPLTSMFQFDETNRERFSDFRPAVHDNDGLLIRNGAGESLWRPLANPKQLQMSLFVDNNPRGFGLMQRARDFDDFVDLEALYHLRPGAWIEPLEDWGPGSITLVEIPTEREIYDNIVAYWQPQGGWEANNEHHLRYRISFVDAAPDAEPVARVLNTRMGERYGGGILAVIDFEDHGAIPQDLDGLTIHISSSTGTLTEGVVQRNPSTNGPRLAFTFDPGEADLVELRAQLRFETKLVSEVWLYRWTRA